MCALVVTTPAPECVGFLQSNQVSTAAPATHYITSSSGKIRTSDDINANANTSIITNANDHHKYH